MAKLSGLSISEIFFAANPGFVVYLMFAIKGQRPTAEKMDHLPN